MQISSIKKRESHLDVVCGILIVYMIFMHCVQWANATNFTISNILGYVFFFFMPWFFFKAGMFFNPGKPMKSIARSSFKRLIKPFVLYAIIGHIFYCINLFLNQNSDVLFYTWHPIKSVLVAGASGGNAPLWFLITLFLVRILAKFGSNFNVKICLLGGGVALLLNVTDFHKPFWFANTMSGIFFFVCGYVMKNLQYNKKFFVATIILYVAAMVFPSHVDMNRNELSCGSYFLWLVFSIGGCVVFDNVFGYVENKFCLPIQKFFESIGKNSMFYYCTHWIVLQVVSIILLQFKIKLSDTGLLLTYVSALVLFYTFTQKIHRLVSE